MAPPKFVMHNPKCVRCNDFVYANEKIEYDTRVYHINCFKCLQCTRTITAQQVAQLNGQIYCKTCFKKIFLKEGKYSTFSTNLANQVTATNSDKPVELSTSQSLPVPDAINSSSSSSSIGGAEIDTSSSMNAAAAQTQAQQPQRRSSNIANFASKFEQPPPSTFKSSNNASTTSNNMKSQFASTMPTNILPSIVADTSDTNNETETPQYTQYPIIQAIDNDDISKITTIIVDEGIDVILKRIDSSNGSQSITPLEYVFTRKATSRPVIEYLLDSLRSALNRTITTTTTTSRRTSRATAASIDDVPLGLGGDPIETVEEQYETTSITEHPHLPSLTTTTTTTTTSSERLSSSVEDQDSEKIINDADAEGDKNENVRDDDDISEKNDASDNRIDGDDEIFKVVSDDTNVDEVEVENNTNESSSADSTIPVGNDKENDNDNYNVVATNSNSNSVVDDSENGVKKESRQSLSSSNVDEVPV